MRAILAFLLPLAACGGGLDTDLEGVYLLDDWTANPAGCNAEGPSRLANENDKALFVEIADFLGVKFVNAVTCTDVAECKAKAAEDTLFLGGFAFEGGNDKDGWKGRSSFASGNNTTCSGSVVDFVMTGDGTKLRIESRRTDASGFTPNASSGFCEADDAVKAAQGQPCTELEVITATFAADL
ncbi:MAG: hypothetical protein KF773_21365 [Deltaproteobacteria bacterium]|nr:hypothetical protein [Deltaproteobacteria bacterium]MCW5806863.1 hypothetical protein [Deltaproteobacteria bacterium]